MLAILEAIRLWRPYLLGRHFKICTDQRSLRYLLEQRITTPEQQRWIAKLVGFDYEIMYKPGRENNAADALSRRGKDGQRYLSTRGRHHTSFLVLNGLCGLIYALLQFMTVSWGSCFVNCKAILILWRGVLCEMGVSSSVERF